MVHSIDELPDEIISYIFSLLTLKDAFRASLSSTRWQHLYYSRRPVLQFDTLNVFGRRDHYEYRRQPEFVKIVDRVMEIWAGKRVQSVIVHYLFTKEYAPYIDRWTAASVGMEVEELDLGSLDISVSRQKYVFPSHLLSFEKAPYLKQLHLNSCTLSISRSNCSWLSNLNKLDLLSVPLCQKGLDLILSAGTNLISLMLHSCCLPKYVCIDAMCLRKLTIGDRLLQIKLNCPRLEKFRYHGDARSVMFAHVPVLREATLVSNVRNGACSLFDHVTCKQVPHLQSLIFFISKEVKPRLTRLGTSGLKKLELSIACEFDLLTAISLLNASPLLETLLLQSYWTTTKIMNNERREYGDKVHYKLKDVEISGLDVHNCDEMEFAMYILKHAVALEKMVISSKIDDSSGEKLNALLQLQKKMTFYTSKKKRCLFVL